MSGIPSVHYVSITDGNTEQPTATAAAAHSTQQLNHLVNRLERIVERLERTVSARELEAVNATLNAVIAESCVPPATPVSTEEKDVSEFDSLPPPSPLPVVETATNIISKPSTSQRSPAIQQLLLYNGDSVDLDILPTVINEQPTTGESLETSTPSLPPLPPPELNANVANASDTPTNSAPVPQSPPTPPPPSPPPPAAEDISEIQTTITANTNTMSVLGFQDIVDGPLAQYLALSAQIGGDVAAHALSVQRAFAAQLAFVQLAAGSAKPAAATRLQELLQPTSVEIAAIQEFREKNRSSAHFNHLSAISESIPALGWVCVAPTPGPHVKEMNDAGQFYTNRVLKDWKDKDVKHVEWARSWVQTLTELQKFVRQHHTTGLVWSGKTDTTAAGAAPPPPPPAGGLPPPPPPMLPPLGDLSLSGGNDDRSALFSQINQGEDITKSECENGYRDIGCMMSMVILGIRFLL